MGDLWPRISAQPQAPEAQARLSPPEIHAQRPQDIDAPTGQRAVEFIALINKHILQPWGTFAIQPSMPLVYFMTRPNANARPSSKEVTNVPGASGPSYRELSSLVIKTDRSEIVRRDQEAGGEMVESLWGKVNLKEMGSRAGREAVPTSGRKAGVLGLKSRKAKYADARDLELDGVGLIYRPRSAETRSAYELILAFVQKVSDFSDQPASVVCSAADEVLTVLKSTEDSWKDMERKERIESILGLKRDALSVDKYSQIVTLARRLTDYPLNVKEDFAAQAAQDSFDVAAEYLDELEENNNNEEADDEDFDNFGMAANVVEEEDEEEAVEEDEVEFEKALPVGKLLSRSLRSGKDTLGSDAIVDIETLAFPEGGHTMTNKKCVLPEKSFKVSKKGYEEIHIPAPDSASLGKGERLLPIAELPYWARPAFSGYKTLNRIQSRLCRAALESPENLLLCAPTGAGKTNVALLSMLHEIGAHLKNSSEGADIALDLNDFKIVYIAPMKALVQEMVRNFTERLAPYGICVAELTGDSSMTRGQLAETQVIVTTPEKWDVVTRKQTDSSSFIRLVRLIIIDEIHLLHDDRGPVLESIVTRTLRQAEQTQEHVRIIGLSATLPNYMDVARFLRVNSSTGVFFFDASYRPCPLAQQFVGITEKKPLKAIALMNEICYEKALQDAESRNQVLIFVHSRKETAKCARAIRDLAIEAGTIGKFLPSDSAKAELKERLEAESKNSDLEQLLPYGFAIHHAGMTRSDRNLVEEAFAAGHLQVLVSTATLAWGVNLPAHTVIIRGTRVYSPEKGCWAELNAQDVLQMLGRAGRPQYDVFGCGIIITSHSELQYYLSLMNSQLPIESQLMRRLVDSLNAEVVLGMVRSVEEGVDWLGYSFLYVRMMQESNLYGVSFDEHEGDPKLRNFRRKLIHSAAIVLERTGLVKYARRAGTFAATELGRIASYYYLTHQSMQIYGENLRPTLNEIDMFRIFAMSSEFKMIPIRAEEKVELAALCERVPVPIKEPPTEDALAKVNILLQAFISQLPLEGFALMADMVYIVQSANRLWRAIYEMCLRRGWARVAHKALNICKMVQHRQWLSHSPLRQLPNVSLELIRRLERKDFPFERLFDLNPAELGELVRAPKQGKELHQALQTFPRLSLAANILPLTHSLLRIELAITPEFNWSEDVASNETFWLTVEDVDQEHIVYLDTFVLRRSKTERGVSQSLTINVPLPDPLPPLYYVRLASDRWLSSEVLLPITLLQMSVPAAKASVTPLLSVPALTPESAFSKHPELGAVLFGNSAEFTAIQTQTFAALYRSDENVLIGASAGSDLLTCAEFAILRHFMTRPQSRVVYLCPVEELLDKTEQRWVGVFGAGPVAELLSLRGVGRLTGELATDLRILEASSLVLCSPHHWDLLSRRWRQRKVVQSVGLVVADKLHFIGRSDVGPEYEVVVSRSRFISTQLEEAGIGKVRIVALSESLSNASEVADWLGCLSETAFNFDITARATSLTIHIESFPFEDTTGSNSTLISAMARPAFMSVLGAFQEKAKEDYPAGGCAIVYVENRRQARSVAVDFLTLSAAESARTQHLSSDYSIFAGGPPITCDEEALTAAGFESSLMAIIPHGIAYYHESMTDAAKEQVVQAFSEGRVQVLVVSRSSMYECSLKAALVVIMGTHQWHGQDRRFVEYQVAEIFEMLGHAEKNAELMTTTPMKHFYRQVLYETLPLESHLDQFLHDPFVAEITSRVVTNKQEAIDYLTWSFLYRRLPSNPHYYGLASKGTLAISEHLSTMVESTMDALSDAGCVRIVDEFHIEPLNLGMVAAYYSIHYATIEMMSTSLQANSRLRGILQVIAAAAEFGWLIPIRTGEDVLLSALHSRCPVRLGSASLKFHDPHVKVALLLQCHFSRFDLPSELESDLKIVLSRAVPFTYALIDVLSSHGWLGPALAAMEFCQMLVQGMWDSDSPLLQLPHFDRDRAQRARDEFSCESIVDFIDLEDEKKLELLNGLNNRAIAQIALASNVYPSDMELKLIDGDVIKTKPGEEVTINVNLSLERDPEDDSGRFVRYPLKKETAWWVAVGEPASRALLAIKRVIIPRGAGSVNVALDLTMPDTLLSSCKVYALCDSWVGCDQELDVNFDAVQE